MKNIERTLLAALLIMACENEDQTLRLAVSGRITEFGTPVAGVTMKLDGVAKATTDVTGEYRIEGLAPATYTLVPEQAGRSFDPQSLTFPLTSGDLIGALFSRIPIIDPGLQFTHGGQTWTMFNPQVYTIKSNTSNSLQLDLAQNGLWFQSSRGGLVYRMITGDFTFSATVNAVKRSDGSQVTCNVCLGGLMARDPNASTENYVHVVTGSTPNGIGHENKTTNDNESIWFATGDGNARHDLRIERRGNNFNLYQKLPTASTWVQVANIQRFDLPATLMVGLNIYTTQTGSTPADLSVIYENITIQ